jgi:hypothetical protein
MVLVVKVFVLADNASLDPEQANCTVGPNSTALKKACCTSGAVKYDGFHTANAAATSAASWFFRS